MIWNSGEGIPTSGLSARLLPGSRYRRSIARALVNAPAGLGACARSNWKELFVGDIDRTVLGIRNALAAGTVFVVADNLSAGAEASSTGYATTDETLQAPIRRREPARQIGVSSREQGHREGEGQATRGGP
jgi:hypothetical protein